MKILAEEEGSIFLLSVCIVLIVIKSMRFLDSMCSKNVILCVKERDLLKSLGYTARLEKCVIAVSEFINLFSRKQAKTFFT
jgi:hypothetical protein